MNILQNIQNILKEHTGGLASPTGTGRATGTMSGQKSGNQQAGLGSTLLNASSGLFGSAALGGLLGALCTKKNAGKMAGGALLAAGGTLLWNKYKERLQTAQQTAQQTTPSLQPPAQALTLQPSAAEDQAKRLIRALVFAAKSDGHIDAAEQKNIEQQLQQRDLGAEAQALIQQALAEPLDPSLIARDVRTAEEALEIYTISCLVIDIDHFMERSYLEALAEALGIPPELRTDIQQQLKTPA